MEADSGKESVESEATVSRRRFLRFGSAALATAAGAAADGRALGTNDPRDSTSKSRDSHPESRVRRLAMVIDSNRCIGCNACSVACKAENGVRLGGFRSWVAEKEAGEYPRVTRVFLPRLCNHCQEPPCLKVCPVGATFKRADGLVDIDKDRCIGCRYCMVACPYGARYFNPRRDPDGERLFPARTRGTVDKCNFCAHRVDNGVVPACVNTCPTSARVFGDLNDPQSEVYRAYHDGRAAPLLAASGTEPSVFYVGGNPRLFEEGLRNGHPPVLQSRRASS